MTMTPKQCRLAAAAMEAGEPMDITKAIELLRSHAAALEEVARVKDDLIISQHCHKKQVSRAEAALETVTRERDAATERADKFMWQVRDTCARAERAEAALAESERKCERLKLTLHEIKEEWAGAECGEPATAQEGYAIELCKRMYRIATEFKEE